MRLDSGVDPLGDRVPFSRFEYRVFASRLGEERARLAAEIDRENVTAHGSAPELREELYLLGPREDRNVKIRDGAIDIKALQERLGSLERWSPLLRVSFPLRGAWVRETLAANLGLERLSAPRPAYDMDALIHEVVAAEPRLRAVSVHKARERFAAGAVRAEFARIRGDRALETETVAVESEDPDVVRTWVRRLGLDRWPNESYVGRLRRALERKASEGPSVEA